MHPASRIVCLVAVGMVLGAVAPAARGGSFGAKEVRAAIAEMAQLVRLGRPMEARAEGPGIVAMIARVSPEERAELIPEFTAVATPLGGQDALERLHDVLVADGGHWFVAAHRSTTSGPERERLLGLALKNLSLATRPGWVVRYRRGVCLMRLGDVASARRELEQATAQAPDEPKPSLALSRILWRAGERDGALALMGRVVAAGCPRPFVKVAAGMLRSLRRQGEGARAESTCRRWIESGKLAEDARSPLVAVLCEARIEEGKLAEAVSLYRSLLDLDRACVVGGLTRLARASATAGPARQETMALLNELVRSERAAAPLVRLAGELTFEDGDRVGGLRLCAASIQGGEIEAAEVAELLRATSARAGRPMAPGALADALALTAVPVAVGDPAVRKTVARTLADGAASRAVDPAMLQKAAVGGAAYAGIPSEWRDWSVKERPDLGRDVTRDIAWLARYGENEGRMPATQRALLERALSGDDRGVLEVLDSLSLVAWRLAPTFSWISQPGMPAIDFFSADTRPVRQESAPPEAMGMLLAARSAFSNGEASRPEKLEWALDAASWAARETRGSFDPLAIDIDGNGAVELSALHDTRSCVRFDLSGYGRPQIVQWLLPGRDAWLAEDVDHDGKITSGRELFGTAGGFGDGFEKLARRDRNGDGTIDGAELAGLLVWRDAGLLGETEEGELIPVDKAGLTAIAIPRAGLRSHAVVNGQRRLCMDLWPDQVQDLWFASTRGDDESCY